MIRSDPRHSFAAVAPSPRGFASTGTFADSSVNIVDKTAIFYRRLRVVIKTILEKEDSRKIYYFLCLNLAYMFVQMM